MKQNRVAFNITDELSDEIDRIASKKGWTRPEIFKRSLTLLRLYLQAEDAGQELQLVGGDVKKQIVVPD